MKGPSREGARELPEIATIVERIRKAKLKRALLKWNYVKCSRLTSENLFHLAESA